MAQALATDWVQKARQEARHKAHVLVQRAGNAFVHATTNGHYQATSADWWTSGFWPGMLWLLYQHQPSAELARLAVAAEDELERTLFDERFYGLHHDVGFQFMPTAVMRYKLTGDRAARRRGLLAAALLMSRFNVAGSVIEAWNGAEHAGYVIIDTLMNLPLLFWASAQTGDQRYRNMAEAHACQVLRHFIRADGSVHHILCFDPHNGTRRAALAGQGFAADSAWSRGQAWAIYGFALAARYTADPLYASAACQVADRFITLLSPEAIPPWDFSVPDRATAPRDSSAAAITASGLLELARLLPPADGEPYIHAALTLLHALHEHCATWALPDEDALLRHATGDLPAGHDVDVSLIYGDYYFYEALSKIDPTFVTCW